MSAWRGWLLLVLGISGVMGSVQPLTTVWRWFEQPGRSEAQAFDPVAGLHGQALTLPPARESRLRLDLTVRSNAVTVQRFGDREHRRLRYRLPLLLVLRDDAGAELGRYERVIDWAEPGSHAQRRADIEAAGGTVELSYDFPPVTPPAAGRVVADLTFDNDRTHGAQVEAAAIAIDARGDSVAVPLVLGVFMLCAGWIAAVCGLAIVVESRAPPARERTLAADVARHRAMACHLVAFAGYLVPFANVVGACLLWLRARRVDAFVEAHGREALNFQLSLLVYLLLAFSLSLAVLGLLMLPLLLLFHVVSTVEAAVAARRGDRFRYPLTFRFLRAPPVGTTAPDALMPAA